MLRVTEDLPGSGGRLLGVPEDFRVDETLPYAPSGTGDHLFVRIEKRGLDTALAARRLAETLEVIESRSRLPAEVGWAGLKDRHAVARQWLSLPWPAERALPGTGPIADGIHILEAARHDRKLRTGHVTENRFEIVIREVPPDGVTRAQTILERLRETGVPNPYGPQRFGRFGDNADRARRVLIGAERRPRDRRLWGLLRSALQSEVFNRVLTYRIRENLFATALAGDLMIKHASGGQFTATDPKAEQLRMDRLEISPTGPLPGKRTRATAGPALELETQALAEAQLTEAMVLQLGVGARRSLRYPLDPGATVNAEVSENQYRLEVSLPSGAYATALLDELVKPKDGPFRRELTDGTDSRPTP